MKVAVIGASGYTGLETLRIVRRHPRLELAAVTGTDKRDGQPLGEAFPALRGVFGDLRFEPCDVAVLAERVDAAILCVPHATAAATAAGFRATGKIVVDLSADFRLRDRETYEAWYGPHKAPELFGQGVYGMPEVYRAELAGAELIASPGCFPTGALLPMLPFLRAGVVDTTTPVLVDAKTGASGAGRTLQDGFLLAELDENAHAYKVANHRHGPEMEQEASLAAGAPVAVTFVPTLLPIIRGISSAVYLRPASALGAAEAQAILADAYASEPFVRVLPPGEVPKLAHVRGSNHCDVAVVVDERAGTLVALSAIDNLVKGSGGQGIQALNVAQGWGETEGLEEAALHP